MVAGSLAFMRPGMLVIARIVLIGGDWLLSGALSLALASQRSEMLQLAAELAGGASG